VIVSWDKITWSEQNWGKHPNNNNDCNKKRSPIELILDEEESDTPQHQLEDLDIDMNGSQNSDGEDDGTEGGDDDLHIGFVHNRKPSLLSSDLVQHPVAKFPMTIQPVYNLYPLQHQHQHQHHLDGG